MEAELTDRSLIVARLSVMMLACAVTFGTALSQTAAPEGAPPVAVATETTAVAAPAGGLRSWGYQLQDIDPAKITGVPYDAFVIDYSRNGRHKSAFTPAEIAQMKVKPDGSKRTVLAYMSIGEAESYRYYWKWWWGDLWFIPNPLTAPAWRGKLNGEWGGNYAVRYWDPAWQAIILGDGGYLDRIVKAGFDGVWLDKVDSSLEEIAEGRATAKADMIAFIKRIGDQARAAKPGFLIFPQNGEALLSDPAYRAMIDGFGKEDLLYGEDGAGKANAPAAIEEKARLLKQLVAEGKPVLSIEYLDDPVRIAAARQQIAGYGFVPHFGDKALSTMRIGDVAGGAGPAAIVSALEATATAPKLQRGGDNASGTGLMLGLTAIFVLIIAIAVLTAPRRRK
jgi:cysteinyl-tRNA synthetase, unknown class